MKFSVLAILVLLPAVGCSRLPVVVEVEGKVFVNRQPLPNARVQFYPELPGFSGDLSSSALTDEQGHFRLRFTSKDEDGAFACKHTVIVTNPPPPTEARGPSETAQKNLTRFLDNLKNRPIPEVYNTLLKSPLVVEVTLEPKLYDLNLTRAE